MKILCAYIDEQPDMKKEGFARNDIELFEFVNELRLENRLSKIIVTDQNGTTLAIASEFKTTLYI